jgi:hypothetical protein
MRALVMGLALMLLAGQGFAAEDEAAKVLAYVEDEMLAADLAEGMYANIAIGLSDLDGDGTNEALVYVMGSSWCGTGGCNLLVLRAAGGSYEELSMMTVANAPIGVLGTSTNGWRDIFVTAGGGGAVYGARRMRFDGVTYPKNPTSRGIEMVDTSGGTLLIAEEDRGTRLSPAESE